MWLHLPMLHCLEIKVPTHIIRMLWELLTLQYAQVFSVSILELQGITLSTISMSTKESHKPLSSFWPWDKRRGDWKTLKTYLTNHWSPSLFSVTSRLIMSRAIQNINSLGCNDVDCTRLSVWARIPCILIWLLGCGSKHAQYRPREVRETMSRNGSWYTDYCAVETAGWLRSKCVEWQWVWIRSCGRLVLASSCRSQVLWQYSKHHCPQLNSTAC